MLKRTLKWNLMGVAVGVFALGTGTAQAEEASLSAELSTSRTKATATGNTDHDRFAGSFGVGYLGIRSVPMAFDPEVTESNGVVSMDATMGEVDAPVIGVRYWFDESLGLDVGLGIRKWSGSSKQVMYERDPSDPNAAPREFSFESNDVSQLGFLLHAGVPIVLSSYEHYTFQVIPEMNIGFSGGTLKDQAPRLPFADEGPVVRDDIKLSGFRFDLGARIGSEIHFGFIGIPNLALQATVGMYLSMQKVKADGGARRPANPSTTVADAQPKTKYEASSTEFTTTLSDSPWGIFQNTISALYYF